MTFTTTGDDDDDDDDASSSDGADSTASGGSDGGSTGGSTGVSSTETGESDSSGTTAADTTGLPGTESGGSDTGFATTGGGSTGGGSSGGGSTGGGSTDGGSTDGGSSGGESSGSGTAGDTDTGGGTGTTGGSIDQCDVDEDCDMGECYVFPVLGGICGECTEDADCPDGGCTPPNLVTGEGAVCGFGNPGDGCETSDACNPDLVCNVIVTIPGISETSTCGECSDEAPCDVGQSCEPVYDVGSLGGQWQCTDTGTLDNGDGCDVDGDGTACASGICASASLVELVEFGVCSECASDDDCPGTCQLAEATFDRGLIPGICV